MSYHTHYIAAYARSVPHPPSRKLHTRHPYPAYARSVPHTSPIGRIGASTLRAARRSGRVPLVAAYPLGQCCAGSSIPTRSVPAPQTDSTSWDLLVVAYLLGLYWATRRSRDATRTECGFCPYSLYQECGFCPDSLYQECGFCTAPVALRCWRSMAFWIVGALRQKHVGMPVRMPP
eukprot:2076034-Rhodomonas_salina.5